MTDPTTGSADPQKFLRMISSHFSQWNQELSVDGVALPIQGTLPPLTDPESEQIKRFRQRLGNAQGQSPERVFSDRALLILWEQLGKPEKWFWSLSHSAGWVLAVGASTPVGVDLEPVDRSLSTRALERLATTEEIGLGVPPLALWCLKEAAYKATLENQGRVISEFKLKKFTPGAGRALMEDPKTGMTWEGRVARVGGFWIAIVRPTGEG